MLTRITQIESTWSEKTKVRGARREQSYIYYSEATVLRVEGSLYRKDAELLESICRDLGSQARRPVALDLADLSFLYSDSALVLRRLTREQVIRLQGLQLFMEKVDELAKESERVARYRPR